MTAIIILMIVSTGIWLFFKLENVTPPSDKIKNSNFKSELNREIIKLKNKK